MTSVKKMKRTLSVGIIVTVAVFMTVAVTSFYDSDDKFKEEPLPIPQILIFPEPPPIDPPQDIPEIDPLNFENLA
tara:strand:+ start:21017 stop:21241 length:225 start_codon:yes stop_codon:yes gene_type:complete